MSRKKVLYPVNAPVRRRMARRLLRPRPAAHVARPLAHQAAPRRLSRGLQPSPRRHRPLGRAGFRIQPRLVSQLDHRLALPHLSSVRPLRLCGDASRRQPFRAGPRHLRPQHPGVLPRQLFCLGRLLRPPLPPATLFPGRRGVQRDHERRTARAGHGFQRRRIARGRVGGEEDREVLLGHRSGLHRLVRQRDAHNPVGLVQVRAGRDGWARHGCHRRRFR